MNTKDHREKMTGALREVFLPDLRAKGFKGSLPHLRRIGLERVDYLSIQHNSSGGSFVVELATVGPDGKPPGYGRNLSIEKLNVQYFSNRLRLGSDPARGQVDHWYEFGPASYAKDSRPYPEDHYREIAKRVLKDFETQGEEWLRGGGKGPN